MAINTRGIDGIVNDINIAENNIIRAAGTIDFAEKIIEKFPYGVGENPNVVVLPGDNGLSNTVEYHGNGIKLSTLIHKEHGLVHFPYIGEYRDGRFGTTIDMLRAMIDKLKDDVDDEYITRIEHAVSALRSEFK